jgi:hypothetical protein
MKMRSASDKHFYIAQAGQFTQQAGNCTFQAPHFMTLYTNVYMCRNCSCGSTSNQPNVAPEKDFERKCCRKLTVIRFSWTLCVFLMGQHSISKALWGSGATHEIMEHQKATSKFNVWCHLMKERITRPFLFQEATVTSNSYLDTLGH